MTEFEIASLAFQETGLSLQEASLSLQEASLSFQEMTAWAAIVTAVVGAVVGPLQCLLIWKGLRLMERSNGERAVALERQREADDRRHAEAMAESERRHAEAMAALAVQRRAMETLIERTAPAGR